MNRKKEFAKNTVILAIGKYFPKLFSFFTLPIITGCLTKSEYGTYDLITTLVSLLLPAVTLQIQSAAFRFLIDCRGDKKESSIVISNIFFFTLLVSTITVCVFFFVYNRISVFTKVLICIYFYIDILQLTIGMSARGLGHNTVYSIQAIINAFINAILIFCFIYLKGWGLNGVLIATIIANIVSYLYVLFTTKFYEYIHTSAVSKSKLKEMLAYSFPMVPNNLSNWILSLSDRLVITAFLGVEANAVYAVANKIPKLLSEANSVVVMGWQENASLAVKDDDSGAYYSSMFDYMFTLIFSATVLLVAATPIMFVIFIRGDYAAAYIQMPLLIIGMFFYCIAGFLGGIYVAHKRVMNVAVTTMVAAAINLIIDFLFINRIGITAGSISTLSAYVALCFYRMFNVRKFEKITYNYRKIIFLLVIMAVMCILTSKRNIICNVINTLVALILTYCFNKDLLMWMINKLLNRVKKKGV